jgi:hypothetical protein
MSKRMGTLLTVVATSSLVVLSTTASFAAGVRDHRNIAGKTYIGGNHGGYGCNCVRTSNASGGVVVTQGGKVVATKVMPAPGSTRGRSAGAQR